MAVVWSIHLFLPFTEPEVSAAKNELNSTRAEISFKEKHLVQCGKEYLSADISRLVFEQTSIQFNNELALLSELVPKQKAAYEALRSSARISGFPSRHKFIYNFGIGLIMCALYYELLKGLRRYEGSKRFEKNYKAITYGTIVGFFIAWIFYQGNDLPPTVYKVVLTILGISISVTAFLVALTQENKLRKLEDSFLEFLLEVRNVHLRKILKHAIKPNQSSMFKEANKVALEEIEKDSEQIEERLREKAKEIID